MLVGMTRGAQSGVMGIAIEGGRSSIDGHVAKGLPAHQALGELKRTVLYHLRIKAAIGSEVDVLKENAIHGGLYLGAHLVGLDVKLVLRLRAKRHKSRQQKRNE